MESESSSSSCSRPHRTVAATTTAASDFFICFTSRFSSSSASSMKLPSKSILSPGRTDKFRDNPTGPMSLSSSLSRRLRSNGSLKGGGAGQASPMFPTGSKKRGCAFDNPEPSSPKVTCIGQVRVKTKKKKKQQQHHQPPGVALPKLRAARSQRLGSGGEVSFRRIESGGDGVLGHGGQERNNQKWVHLPLTICEALRAFGAEFNCFLPCRSSCASSNERGEEVKDASGAAEEAAGSSCGAAFARWLVAMQEGEGGSKGREIEFVVGGGNGEEGDGEDGFGERLEEGSWRRRRGGFGENDIGCLGKDGILEEGGGGESVCVPPKNALLLMRCRSDPMRMSALASRLWESSVAKNEEDGDGESDDGEEEEEEEVERECEAMEEREEVDERWVLGEATGVDRILEKDTNSVAMEEESEAKETPEAEAGNSEMCELEDDRKREKEQEQAEEKKPVVSEAEAEAAGGSASENPVADPALLENEDDKQMPISEQGTDEEKAEDENGGVEAQTEEPIFPSVAMVSPFSESEEISDIQEAAEEQEREGESKEKVEALAEILPLEGKAQAEASASPSAVAESQEESTHQNKSDPDLQIHDEEEAAAPAAAGGGGAGNLQNERKLLEAERSGSLGDSLLLQMMFEPKLSMEVSKETWVRSTDFIRRPPQRRPPPPVGKIDGQEEPRKRNSTDSRPPPALQPARSSCSLPAPAAAAARTSVSMASMIEQRLVNAVAYEPFVLTRCKSEPMRTAAAKFAPPPDACFWKNRKLELHRAATAAPLGMGAAGIGF